MIPLAAPIATFSLCLNSSFLIESLLVPTEKLVVSIVILCISNSTDEDKASYHINDYTCCHWASTRKQASGILSPDSNQEA